MKIYGGVLTRGEILSLKWTEFLELTKVRLSSSVVFSSVAGYLLAVRDFNFVSLVLLTVGGYAMVGASNVFNQVMEKELDFLMNRTRNRPLPSGKVTPFTALLLASLLTLIGMSSLFAINWKTAFFGGVSILLYTLVYTPLKTRTPLAVLVGAVPGAIPFMLGWVAATGTFGIEPGTLFMIQFFWQFPHFWALAWMLDDDYRKGGFKMLPTGQKDQGTALQIVLYTIWTLLVSVIPYWGVSGALKLSLVGMIAVAILGGFMLRASLELYRERTRAAARRLMLNSVLYITLLQIIYVIDHFIRQSTWI